MGLILLIVIIGYVFLARFIVKKVYEQTEKKLVKNVALAIFVLIPTWDVMLGYPIYTYLCIFESGAKIYKTVDNIDGFYMGEDYSTYSNMPPLPYEGYNFIEYKKKKNQKSKNYYRVSWVDANNTNECIQIGNASSEYNLNLYKQGKCIVEKEIAESEVSELWSLKKEVDHYMFFYLNIYRVHFVIENRKNHKKYFTVTDYFVDKSWMTALNIVSGNKHKQNCFEKNIYSTSSGFEISDKFILETLKTKKEER